MTMKMSERLYHRYEYLAVKYASKIFSFEQLSFEREDLIQEFRIKIYTSIKAYGRRWLQYRRGLSPRPVPLKYYLGCACANKAKDFAKYISRENYKQSLDGLGYDYGVADDTIICPERNVFTVRGVDLLEGLSGSERAIFSLYLRGYQNGLLTKVYIAKAVGKRPSEVIAAQKSYLINKYGSELLQQTQVFETYQIDNEN